MTITISTIRGTIKPIEGNGIVGIFDSHDVRMIT